MIIWKDEYQIGVDEVDQQHQFLFRLINETLKCNERAALQLCLVKLYKYTREHFNAEEAIMKKIGYEDYKQHQKQHNVLISTLNKKSSLALEDPTKRPELDSFLVSWLIVHIMGQDMPIGDFLRNKASK